MNNPLSDYWNGKAVLITGASSGLGRAITEALSPYKVKFCLLSRRVEAMQDLAERLKESGSSFWLRGCDVRDREQVQQAVQAFSDEAKQLDVAWVNSGISRDSSFQSWDWQATEDMIDTNLKGAIYTVQSCLEVMVPRGSGTIVGIGSAACMRGLPGRGVYSLTKVGLDFYLQGLAPELPSIQFTMIHPGFVDTPINQNNPNRFWLLTPQRAADLMIKAVAKRKRVLIYPFRMNVLFRLVRSLPLPLYELLARRAISFSRPSQPKGAASPAP